MPRLFVQTLVYGMGFWNMLVRLCLCDNLTVRSTGAESLMGFLGQKHTFCCVFTAWK